jgi:hypothetical protein
MTMFAAMTMLTRLIFAFALAGLIPATALAAKPKALLKNPQHWGAFIVKEDGGNACYMAGKPLRTQPDGVKRGNIWLLVTHRPYRKVHNEVSIYIGYPFKPKSTATVEIDGKKFEMFTDDETAWAADAKTDEALVAAMRAGNKMVVRGLSQRGTDTVDDYSLIGFTKAHEAISDACKVK